MKERYIPRRGTFDDEAFYSRVLAYLSRHNARVRRRCFLLTINTPQVYEATSNSGDKVVVFVIGPRRLCTASAAMVGSALLVALFAPAVHADEHSGPELSVRADRLDRSLECSGLADDLESDPVLLIPGTTLTPEVNFSWNYVRAFEQTGRAYCTVRLPNRGMTDIQLAAEYVVHALRTMHRRATGKIDVLGYSQGGMVPRWALKFWPDTRHAVDDMVGIDPSNYGTLLTAPLCLAPCQPSLEQQQVGSNFLQTLNEGPDTYPGVDYTVIYTLTDEVVIPNFGPRPLSRLRDGDGDIANIPVQRVCPAHVAEHITMGTTDPVGYALATDALDHQGTADSARIDRSVCSRAFMPGVNPAAYPQHMARLTETAVRALASGPRTLREPPLRPYAR